MSNLVVDDGPTTPETYLATRRRRESPRWTLFVGIALGATLAMLAVAGNWFLQRNLLLDDDTERGLRYAETLQPPEYPGLGPKRQESEDSQYVFSQCRATAEAIYGHAMFDGSNSGWAPRSEKAFFVACSGASAGGFGGGD